MAVLGIDELHVAEYYTPTNKPVPYREYFGEMDLDEDEIQRRISMAEDLEGQFKWLFGSILLGASLGALDGEQFYVDALYERYRDVVESYGFGVAEGYQRVDDYIYGSSSLIVQNTLSNLANGYFTSDARAIFCAEEESNSVGECKDFVAALIAGKRTKQWSAIIDKRTRDHHRAYDGTVVPIEEPFEINGSKMMFPRDSDTFGASAEEIVNCRCHAIYF